MKKLISIFVLFTLSVFLTPLALTAQDGQQKALNYTPPQVLEKVKWMPKARLSGGLTDAADDIYFLQSSIPAPGYVHLRDGRILSGSLQIQKKFNKSEKDVNEKCIMVIDGKRKVYSDWEAAYYYVAFNPSALGGELSKWSRVGIGTSSYFEYKVKGADAPAEIFGKGTLNLANGEARTGVFAFDYARDRSGRDIYETVYFAESESANVIIYDADAVSHGVKAVKGKEYHFQRLFFGLTEREGWIEALKAGKANGTNNLVKASIVLDNDQTYIGSVGFDKGKVPTFAFFVNEDNSFVAYYDGQSDPQAQSISATVDGKEIEYTFNEDGFYSLGEMTKLWEKNTKKKNAEEIHSLVDGSITLNNGTELKGKVAQQTRGRGVFFQDATGLLRIHRKSSIRYFSQTLSTGVTKFAVVAHYVNVAAPGFSTNKPTVQLEYTIINYTAKAATIKNTGLVRIGAKQIDGKVMIEGNDVWCIDGKGALTVERCNKVTSVQVNEPSGARVFYGGPQRFNELFFPFEAISYYRNPYPTHCNERASKIADALNETLGALAKGATVVAMGQGAENKNKSLEQLAAEVEELYGPPSHEACSVPYEEYFLVFNNTKERMVVYKENIKSVVTSLMLGCESLEKINKLIRKNDNVNDIHDMVKYVNDVKCASAKFEVLEPTPLAGFKWRSGLLSPYHYDEAGKKGTKRAMTDWYKGWIQTLGGNKTEGLIRVIGDKTIENREMTKVVTRGDKTVVREGSSIMNRKISFEYDAVELRIIHKGKIADVIYSFYLDKDAIRSVGREKEAGAMEGQYTEFTDVEAYEPTKELFLSEEVKVFNPNGSFTSSKGETFEGKITINIPPRLWFGESASYEDADGNKITLSPKNDIKQLRVKTESGEEKIYVPFRDIFVELRLDGAKFRYFRNPYPESKATGAGLVQEFAATANATSTPEQKKTFMANPPHADPNKLETYKEEYVFLNTETNEEIILHIGNDKRILQSYLGLCDYFNGLDKKQKDEYLSIKDPKTVMDVLNKCY